MKYLFLPFFIPTWNNPAYVFRLCMQHELWRDEEPEVRHALEHQCSLVTIITLSTYYLTNVGGGGGGENSLTNLGSWLTTWRWAVRHQAAGRAFRGCLLYSSSK